MRAARMAIGVRRAEPPVVSLPVPPQRAPRPRREPMRGVLSLLALLLASPGDSRTCLSTRKDTPPSCSPKCRADRASRHCQACVCVRCAFCKELYEAEDAGIPSTVAGAIDETAGESATVASVPRVPAKTARARRRPAPIRMITKRPLGRHKPAEDEQDAEASEAATSVAASSSADDRPGSAARAPVDASLASEKADIRLTRAGSRRWTPTANLDEQQQRNQSLLSIVLRGLGYIPGPQLPLDFGGSHEDFTVVGASSMAVLRLVELESHAAGPTPLSLRAQRQIARKKARAGEKSVVDWHSSPVAGLLPQHGARPVTPNARTKKRRNKQASGSIQLGGALVGAQNLSVNWDEPKPKRKPKSKPKLPSKPKRSARPNGDAPEGKKWDPSTGQWVTKRRKPSTAPKSKVQRYSIDISTIATQPQNVSDARAGASRTPKKKKQNKKAKRSVSRLEVERDEVTPISKGKAAEKRKKKKSHKKKQLFPKQTAGDGTESSPRGPEKSSPSASGGSITTRRRGRRDAKVKALPGKSSKKKKRKNRKTPEKRQ